MSLLSDQMKTCVMLIKTSSGDGYGGFSDSYTEGTAFDAAIVLNTSAPASVGASQDVKNTYTVTTGRSVSLNFKDHFKRVQDSKYFEVVSDGDERKTPESTALDMRQVTAAEWSIPNG